MLTKMTEETWSLVVDIFRQVCPRHGQKGAGDRRILEALHYFTVHNITWRALPETFGDWNTIWKRSRSCRAMAPLRPSSAPLRAVAEPLA